MTFPRRLTFALFLICCLQHANASNSSINTSTPPAQASSYITAQANSTMTAQTSCIMTTQANGSTSAVSKTCAMTAVSTTTITVGTKSTAATDVTTSTKASNSSSAYARITNTPVTTSSSMSTMQNASFSIGSGTEYSLPHCTSCSNGGTITVTMSCNIKIKGSDDKKCDRDKFNGTSCDYVTLANKMYGCAEVKKNFTYFEKEHLKSVKECKVVCQASGSVLYPHVVFIFASGLVVRML
ncbi:uncharacterized protein LOC111334542 [Stylophora pistillata]|uniref:uncharacterized protein LOC111334542 n=1 Tax=Stylophora pistillata TaxID=50429 RepID=UPI000C043097|nr:uncharacterized protein LOC111334542 [Stylophora pistillata]